MTTYALCISPRKHRKRRCIATHEITRIPRKSTLIIYITKHRYDTRKSNTFYILPPPPCLARALALYPPPLTSAYPSRMFVVGSQALLTQGRNPDVFGARWWTPDPGLPYLHSPVSLAWLTLCRTRPCHLAFSRHFDTSHSSAVRSARHSHSVTLEPSAIYLFLTSRSLKGAFNVPYTYSLER